MQFASGNNISITLNHDAKCIYSIISYTNVDQVYSLTLNGNNIGLGTAMAATNGNGQSFRIYKKDIECPQGSVIRLYNAHLYGSILFA